MKAVSANSNNGYELKEPSLYTSLKRLEKQGHIVSYWGDESQGGRRKYYHITDSGLAAFEKALAEWLHSFDREQLEDIFGSPLSNLLQEDKWIRDVQNKLSSREFCQQFFE